MENEKERDLSECAPQFTEYLNDRSRRLTVKTRFGEIWKGYVGRTTGWKPAYILLHDIRSIGSWKVLHKDDVILSVKRMKR